MALDIHEIKIEIAEKDFFNIAINDLILLETELIGLVLTTYIGWRMVKMH